jgi:hypothetical protein
LEKSYPGISLVSRWTIIRSSERCSSTARTSRSVSSPRRTPKKLAAGLRGVSGGGLEAKVMPVLTAWTELARLLDSPPATVADLDPDVARAIAERVWVVPPGGTLLP